MLHLSERILITDIHPPPQHSHILKWFCATKVVFIMSLSAPWLIVSFCFGSVIFKPESVLHYTADSSLEMPMTARENWYVVVLVDYLTKWMEAYPTEDQSSKTIAKLLVVSLMEFPTSQGDNLLSTLIWDVLWLVGMKKINTTSYHPQLVERMNKTL